MARRSASRTIHRTLGLFLGAWFALVGLTGAILVYEDEVDAWLNPALFADRSTGPRLLSATVVDRALDDHPLAHVERVRPPAHDGEPYRLVIRVAPHMRVESPRIEAFYGSASGEKLGHREAETIGVTRPYLLRTLYEFHRNVLLGYAGSNIVGIAGFLLMASAITGIAIALPRNRRGWLRLVGIKVRAGPTRALFDVHRSTGTLIDLLIVLATATGVTLVYLNYTRDIVSLFSDVAPFPTVPWRTVPLDGWPSFEEIDATVRGRYPDLVVTEVHVPSKPTAGYVYYLRGAGDVHRLGDTIVWVHPATGEMLFERSSRTRTTGEGFMHWLFPLHSGTAFGAPGRAAMCAAGLAPFLLVLTGLWVWTRKRRGERIEERRRAGRQNTSVRQAGSSARCANAAAPADPA